MQTDVSYRTGWLTGWLAGWLTGWLAGWLAGWLSGLIAVDMLGGWLAGSELNQSPSTSLLRGGVLKSRFEE